MLNFSGSVASGGRQAGVQGTSIRTLAFSEVDGGNGARLFSLDDLATLVGLLDPGAAAFTTSVAPQHLRLVLAGTEGVPPSEAGFTCIECGYYASKKSELRAHIGGHILLGDRALSGRLTEVCGFCLKSDPLCLTSTSQSGGVVKLVSNCRQFPGSATRYGAALKGSIRTPCTNVPIPCNEATCKQQGIHYWRYNIGAHYDTHHPDLAATQHIKTAMAHLIWQEEDFPGSYSSPQITQPIAAAKAAAALIPDSNAAERAVVEAIASEWIPVVEQTRSRWGKRLGPGRGGGSSSREQGRSSSGAAAVAPASAVAMAIDEGLGSEGEGSETESESSDALQSSEAPEQNLGLLAEAAEAALLVAPVVSLPQPSLLPTAAVQPSAAAASEGMSASAGPSEEPPEPAMAMLAAAASTITLHEMPIRQPGGYKGTTPTKPTGEAQEPVNSKRSRRLDLT